MLKGMYILGIWDGHDAGACIVEDGKIKVAINEERLTRKKLDIKFPDKSIIACLNYLKLKPTDITVIASCGTQLTRILARSFASLDKEFYNFRRRLIPKPRFERTRRFIKYYFARYNTPSLKKFTEFQVKKRLNKMGFKDYKIYIVDHHLAHAASAVFTSGFDKCLCITLDGVGDGLSGSVNVLEDGELKKISSIPEKDSLAIMYEEATTILGFRELEDEGKVMAMADYSYPIPDDKNPLIKFFTVDSLQIKAKHSTIQRFKELEKIKWNTPIERFAYMTQRALEENMLQFFQDAIEETGIKNVCWAGGIASNIKANRIMRLNSGLKKWFVFPQMGDGGLAVGAALHVDYQLNGIKPYKLQNAYLGPEFNEEKIKEELKKWKQVKWEESSDIAGLTADLINKGNYVFWYQGRMEYGPRALGNRSIVAPADSEDVKELLNLHVKKREWFQPFCPSMLEEEAKRILEDYDSLPDRFMTMGYMSKKELKDRIKSIIHVDGSMRPQMVGKENILYHKLIEEVKRLSGDGIVLNTSFNIHGEPIVCTPKDALETMIKTKTKHMALGNFFIELK
jgi:carbamoyltransferase